ncbi:MAG: FprA family A-type flavoprotein [Solobacterium sp.]|nr:FprA family A-type flavoprotein [Solobacterium sp.]
MNHITKDIKYVGVNDHQLDLFEGQFIVPEGMAYNSYVILDEKTAVLDSVDAHFGEEWMNNLKEALAGRTPDYLIVQHMEPDHSANITRFLQEYPDTAVVGSAQTFVMLKNFYGDLPLNKVTVKENDELELGSHVLKFVMAPMVHWPEVMMTYDKTDKVFFTADAFGKFGALDVEEDDWACEARRYYFGIVGKYGAQVTSLLKKAAGLEIETICPLHGPVLQENLGYYLDLYTKWASYTPEDKGVTIAYASVYGHTAEAAKKLAEMLEEKGIKTAVSDLCRCDIAEAVEDAFCYDRIVLASTTYNTVIFPKMREFIDELTERGYQNRTMGFIENGTWAPMAAKVMKGKFETAKNITMLEPVVTIRSALNEASLDQLRQLADALANV